MKRILTFLFVLLMLASLVACNISDYLTDDSTDMQINSSEISSSEQQPKAKHSNLDLFIEEYNKVATTKIIEPIEIDIQSDQYYRTEFRLNAFKNAPAYLAKIGDNSIELINFNYEWILGSDLRIYTTVDTLEAATDVFESFCKAGDPEITQADFDDFYEYHTLDAGDVRPVIGDISGSIIVKDGKYEIMLDASSPDYFD